METPNSLQTWIMTLDRRMYAVLVGLSIGVIGGLVALLLAVAGPLIAIIGVSGLLVALYVLTDVRIALYGAIATLLMLPFGTLPFRIGFTPSLLDMALGAFVMVYLFQWMTGKRQRIHLTPVHPLILLYIMWVIFAFLLGLQYGNPTSNNIRQFAAMLLSVSLTVFLVDLMRDKTALRQLILVIMLFVGVQAALAIVLWALPDVTAESLLVRLSRIGYPDGGVIRYVEANPELGERAIGTWVDPNALGGILAVGAALIAPQLFAKRPVINARWLTWGIVGLTGIAVVLTNSRGSFLALAIGLFVTALLHYRRFLPVLFAGGIFSLFLPPMQRFIGRIFEAFTNQDLATQMRVGEWTDSLNLISQYPISGIGFTGTPTANLYTDVANMYLIMTNQIGITGVILFLIAMGGVFLYGWRAWLYARHDVEWDSIILGYHVALLTALINAFVDLYYFRLDFQSSITWFWLTVSLALASSRLVLEQYKDVESTEIEEKA